MEPIFEWYIKDRVIFHRGFGDQSLEQIQQNNNRFIEMIEAGRAPVHIIVDAQQVSLIPIPLFRLSQTTSFFKHPSLGWFVAIPGNPITRFIAGFLPQIAGLHHYRVMRDFDSAAAFLKEKDVTLDWSKVNHNLFIT
ncbi:MAG: hypothetical protein GC179_13290 [Anaerolineaceae bacterium]|nr:hypothetical protein [Anaerolineaceae bacterium]